MAVPVLRVVFVDSRVILLLLVALLVGGAHRTISDLARPRTSDSLRGPAATGVARNKVRVWAAHEGASVEKSNSLFSEEHP